MQVLLGNTRTYSLLKLGVASILIAFVFIGLSIFEIIESKTSNLYGDLSFRVFALQAILLAPIFEELAFRGWFFRKSKYRIISYVVLIVLFCTLFGFSLKTFIYILISAIILILWELNKIGFFLTAIFSTVLFMLAHLDFSQTVDWSTFVSVFSRLGMGFVLVYLMRKYNILYSILGHFIFNLLLVTAVFYNIQFVDTSQKQVNVKNAHLQYQAVPYLQSFKTSYSGGDTLHYEKGTIKHLLKLHRFDTKVEIKNSGLKSLNLKPYQKYNLKFWIERDTSITEKDKAVLLFRTLKEAELIRSKPIMDSKK